MKAIAQISACFLSAVLMTGCATMPNVPPPMPTRLQPDVAPDNKQTLKAVKGGVVELASGPYLTLIKATLNDHVVYVHILFNNQGKSPVSFGPEDITLADPSSVLIRTLSPTDIVQPYVSQAQNAEAQASAVAANAQGTYDQMVDQNQQESEAQAQRRQNGDDRTNLQKTADNVQDFSSALSAIGAQYAASQAAYQAQSAEQALQVFNDRINVGTLQSQKVPPRTKTQGIVYFAEPTQWPVTLRILIDGHALSAQFRPTAPISMPPQVAISRKDYLTGKSSDDYAKMAADLRRSTLVDSIFLEALPLTPSLVEIRERDRGFKKMLSQAEVQNNVQTALASLRTDKSEFDISLGAYDPNSIDPALWKATLIDSQYKEYPVTLTAIPRTSSGSYVTAYYETRLIGSSEKIDFSKPFQLSFYRSATNYSQPLNVAWQVIQGSTTMTTPQLLKELPDSSENYQIINSRQHGGR